MMRRFREGLSLKESLASRLAGLFALVTLVFFTLVGTGLYAVMQTGVRGQLRAVLDARTDLARTIIAQHRTAASWHNAQERLAALVSDRGTTLISVWSANPGFRFGEPIDGERRVATDSRYVLIQLSNRTIAMLTRTVTIPAYGERPEVRLTVAEDRRPMLEFMHIFILSLAGVTGLAMLLMLVLVGWLARFSLRPLTQLAGEASALSPSHRSQRLRTRALPAELRALAVSFNGALERLDASHARLEAFNADVAHELRTPVGIMIGQTQVALTSTRCPEALLSTLQSNLEELERTRTIINDMLFISRADRGERARVNDPLPLAAEVQRTLDFLEMSFEDAQIQIVLEGDAVARVNRSLFGRALTNLLLNAIKHAPPGSTVTVTLCARETHRTPLRHGTTGNGPVAVDDPGETNQARRLPDQYGAMAPSCLPDPADAALQTGAAGSPARVEVEIGVANQGPPIPDEQRARLFDRFFRLDASRTNSQENHGLGLSIVRAVADMHGGAVFLRCEGGINTFGFTVPGTPECAA